MPVALLALALLAPGTLTEAVEAEPDRPGLRIRLAHELLRQGDVDAAVGQARQVLKAWPRSVRARLVLAGAARARGEVEAARTYLEEALAMAPGPIAGAAERAQARLQAGARISTWRVRGSAGAFYDTRALPSDPDVSADAAADPSWRALVGAGVDWKQPRGRLLLRAGGHVDRSAHFLGPDDVGTRDRLLLRTDGRATYGIPDAGLVGARVEGRGALVGRTGEVHHGGGGLGLSWGRGVHRVSPWLDARGLYFRFAERAGHEDPDAFAVEAGAGVATHWRRLRGTLRLGALRVVNDDGYDEALADLGGDVVLGPVQLSGRAGAALRDEVAVGALRPRAALVARWTLRYGVALLADARWRAADPWTRWVGGLSVEVSR